MSDNTIGRRTFVKAVGAGAVVASSGVASAAKPPAKRFKAHLSGDEEVPPVDTKAQGQANFKLSKDGSELSYKVNVANIENVTKAHIHNEEAGLNGPVVAWLYPATQAEQLIPGRTDGTLAEGIITAGDLVGPLAGKPLSDLLDEMRDGRTYVNVHTIGKPGGEIRGQIS